MPSDSFQSRILANWIISDDHRKIAILYINNAWGKGVTEEFIRIYKTLGGSIAAKEACKEGDRDFRVQLVKIREVKPSALFCPTMPKEGGIILKQIKELGINLPIYGADAWSVDELINEARNAAEGVMYTYPAQFVGKEYQAFLSVYKEKYGDNPDVNAAGAYDAVKILAMCMSKVLRKGLLLTGDNIREELEVVKNYMGATGNTTFDENGDSIGKSFDKMIISNALREKYE